jgi:TonB-dependent receptor
MKSRFPLSLVAITRLFIQLVTIAIMLAGAIAVAQSGRGTVSGRVTDPSGAVLQGARVELQPGNSVSISNTQGEFNFLDIPTGSYNLGVSYVGFSVFAQDVTIKAGETTNVNAILKVESKTEAVTVTTNRQFGEAEAINRQRTSDNILNVLPVEIITSLPNTNIADALGRLPSVTLERDEGEGKYVQIRGLEPRLANVTINGIEVPSPEGGVRQIKLDVIPSNLVDSVEINKTLSANQDGDAIAGSVNLVTKTAQERPTFYLNGYVGYNPIQGGRNSYELDSTVGKRFGASKRLGVLIGGSYDWNGRGIDDIESSPGVIQCDAGPNGCVAPVNPQDFTTYGGQDLRLYSYYRSRYGITGSIDYKLKDPVSGLYARFIYSHFNNFGDRWVYSPSINSYLTPSLSADDGEVSSNSQIRRPVEVIGSLDMGGKHVFTRWLLAYEFAIARSASEDHGYSSANFSNINSDYQYNIDTTNPLIPKLIPVGGYSKIYDPTTYQLSDGDVSNTYSPQLNLSAGFSAARNYNLKNHFSTFEFGFKFRNAHKFQDTIDRNWVADQSTNSPDLLMSNFLSNATHSDYYGNDYPYGRTTNFASIRSFINTSPLISTDENATDQSTIPNNYDLIEKVTAGYIMNTIQFGRTRVQAGLRFEGTNESILGNIALFDPDSGSLTSITQQHTNSSYVDVLPSIQVRVDLGHDADLRVSYGRGISRPNYGDLPPFITTVNFSPDTREVDAGNPFLKPTRANNYDILVEKYLQPLGLIQGGFFYKQLYNPIVQNKFPITQDFVNKNPQFANFLGDNLFQPNNAAAANVWGFEMAYQQHFTFLPGFLRGLGFSGNYGYTHSSTDGVFNRTDHPALQRQAPNSWNISPTYDRGRLSMRLGISYNDANIFQYNFSNLNPDGTRSDPPLGIRGPNGDVYLYAHTQVDAQGSFRMYKGLELIVSGLNLTNEVFGFYQGSQIYPIQREFYRPTYAFGLRYTMGSEGK